MTDRDTDLERKIGYDVIWLEPETVSLSAPSVRADSAPQSAHSWWRGLWRGRQGDPPWVRPALIALLVGTGCLYLWDLSINGWGNDFYAAAVQAGSTSWKAFFFGSSDGASLITVDKPPASLWPMALAVRVFGLNAWSVLVPQALMGVGTVGVVYAAVRRWFGAAPGLIAGVVVALTPVATLMFRYDNPDALLTLLMAAAAYTALRAVEDGRWRWFALTGVAIGFGFLTKQLQVMLVVPGFALAGIIAAPGNWWRRVRGLLLAGGAMVLSAGWWVAVVQLVPAANRPYVGGSPTNNFLELTFGYNGLGRLSGDEAGGLGGGTPGGLGGGNPFGGGGIFGGTTGPARLFSGAVGNQIAWLIPAALVAIAVGLIVRARAPRRDPQRASVIVWGSWLLVTGVVFSAMHGIFHEYYTVALAPSVGALVGIGVSLLWKRRQHWAAPATAAATVAFTTWWARDLLGRADGWNPWITTVVTVAGTLATLGLVAVAGADVARRRPPKLGLIALGVAAAIACLAGPAAWAIDTVTSARTGPIVTAGPAVRGDGGPGGFPGGNLSGELPGAGAVPDPGSGSSASIPDLPGFPGTQGGFPTDALNGARGIPDLPAGMLEDLANGQGGLPGLGGAGGAGFGGSTAPSTALVAALSEDADKFTWVGATTGATAAAPYQLAVQRPVMPIGGFSGTDPSPTLDQFKQYVADHKIHWFIGSARGGFAGVGGAPSGGNPAGVAPSADGSGGIAQWVADTFTSTTIDGVTLYDLTKPTNQN